MVAMDKSQLQAEITRLLQNNLAGDIEADEVRRLLIDFTDSVTFPAPAALPQIRSFSIQNQETVVNAGFGLAGGLTFLYSVTDPAQISGNLTISQGGATLSVDIIADMAATDGYRWQFTVVP